MVEPTKMTAGIDWGSKKVACFAAVIMGCRTPERISNGIITGVDSAN